MASVHLGWVAGPGDFSRLVAIKRMHPQLADDQHFVARFRDEAWLSSRLLHPNIVQVFDVVDGNGELLIVMEYIHGVSLRSLWADARAAGYTLPLSVIAGILVPSLHGLHAAHEATDDHGHPIGIVHRDFSPQNIMACTDGHAKILDFGIAKARTHMHVTSTGLLSGKLGYLSPEQIQGGPLDRRSDVFAAGIVFWEMLTGRRLFCEPGVDEPAAIYRALKQAVRPPSTFSSGIPRRLDAIVLQALEREPERRFESARALALEIESAVDVASASRVADWIGRVCTQRVAELSKMLNKARRAMAEQQSPAAVAPPPLVSMTAATTGEAATAVTAVTVNEVAVPSRARPLRWAAVGVVCLALAVGAASRGRLRGLWRHSSPARNAAVMVSPASVSVAPPAQAWQPVPPSPAELPPSASSQALPVQAHESAALPAKRLRAPIAERPQKQRGSSSARRSFARKPDTPAKAAVRPNCDPPTYVDPDGIRIFKDECL